MSCLGPRSSTARAACRRRAQRPSRRPRPRRCRQRGRRSASPLPASDWPSSHSGSRSRAARRPAVPAPCGSSRRGRRHRTACGRPRPRASETLRPPISSSPSFDSKYGCGACWLKCVEHGQLAGECGLELGRQRRAVELAVWIARQFGQPRDVVRDHEVGEAGFQEGEETLTPALSRRGGRGSDARERV